MTRQETLQGNPRVYISAYKVTEIHDGANITLPTEAPCFLKVINPAFEQTHHHRLSLNLIFLSQHLHPLDRFETRRRRCRGSGKYEALRALRRCRCGRLCDL